MKVLFTCSDRPQMSRNKYYRTLLSNKYEYTECVSHSKTYAKRLPSIFFQLLFKMRNKDVYFVSYMGYFLVIFLRIFSKKPIIFDYYVSLHEMMCGDRNLFPSDSWRGKFTFWLDKRSLELADYIIVDTTPLINGAVNTYGIDRNKFMRLPVAVNEEMIHPVSVPRHKEVFTLVYMGSYIPFHGVDRVINAAKILQDKGIAVHFLMLGEGQTFKANTQLAKDLKLTNVEFISYVSMEELNIYYNASDITLGAFSGSDRSKMFITNKAYESFAVGKPHLTVENNALNELFTNDKDIFYIQEPTAQALASRIIEIKENKTLCDTVADNALKLYQDTLSNEKVTQMLEAQILSKFS